MGWVYASELAKAGKHLTDVLVTEIEVPYSRFYNTAPDTEHKLNTACGFDTREEHAHLYVEWAAQQLAAAGFVTMTPQEATLIDGEPDFMIAITEKYLDFLNNGEEFSYYDMDL